MRTLILSAAAVLLAVLVVAFGFDLIGPAELERSEDKGPYMEAGEGEVMIEEPGE
jgi:hypothetical protein